MFRRSTLHGIVLLILYIGYMVIIGSDSVAIASLKWHLKSNFEMKDLSFLHYFLCIEVAYSSRGYLLSQQKYIADLLECATLSNPSTATSSSFFTPMKLHSNSDAMMVLYYCSLHVIGNWWDPLYIFCYSTKYLSGCSCPQSVCSCSHINTLCDIISCDSLSPKHHLSIIAI